MRQALCTVLAQFAGQPLTMEVAQQIVGRLCPANPIDIAQFRPITHGDYVIAAERFADHLAELDVLHRAHWLETEKYRHGLALNPDYPSIAELERAGKVLQLTMRKAGALVGHLRLYIARSLHTQTLYAEEDSLFIDTASRGGFAVVALLRYAEACIWSLPQLEEIRVNSKLANRADVLMKRIGYQATALQHTKFRPKENGHVL